MGSVAADSFAGGRYSVERVLGHGGMATVYLARDADLDRLVAVKVLGDPLAADDEFVERFRREARTAAQLSHPNVVQVYDTGEEDGRIFIVMEYVEGEGLDALLRREGRLDPDRARDLGLQICAALHYAHGKGVVHRDVKPGNLLLRPDGVVKVADFGIARPAEGTELTQAGTVLGTAAYLAPEVARGERATERSDIFAAGAVLYELLTGRPPFRIETLAQLATRDEQELTPVRELEPAVHGEVEEAVMRALARDPRYRHGSAAELAAELGGDVRTAAAAPATDATRVLGGATNRTNRTVPLPSRRRPAWSGRAWAAALLAAVALVVLGAVALASGDGGETPPAEEGGGRAPRVEPVPASEDPGEQARNLAEWIRDHAASD